MNRWNKKLIVGVCLLGLLISHLAMGQVGFFEPVEDDFVLAVGDRLRLDVERHAQYSGRFIIQPDGSLNHPLLGVVPAAGLTIGQLRETLRDEFGRYLKRPVVFLSLESAEPGAAAATSRDKVFLMGEVRQAGGYDLEPGMTVLQLLASSGGPILHPMRDSWGNIRSTGGNIRNISVFRSTGETVRVDLEYIQQSGDQSDNIVLMAGDTVYVPPGSPGQYSVLGQVRRPGSYPVEGKMNLMEALVQAGGFATNGSLRNIRIVRAAGPDPQTYRVNLWETLKGGRLEMIPEVQAGDVIFVEHTPFYHWARFVESMRGAAISSEAIRVMRDFDERTTQSTVTIR